MKSQVKNERGKQLTGRARKPLETSFGSTERFEDVDFEESKTLLPSERRLCKLTQRAKDNAATGIYEVSSEKLLKASLNSLENILDSINKKFDYIV